MKISVLAETFEFDLKLYVILIKKIFFDLFEVKNVDFLPAESSLFIGSKGKLVKILDQRIDILADSIPSLDYIFVLVDCDDLTYNKQKTEITKKINLIQNFPKYNVITGLPMRNIEAWLISDAFKILNVSNTNIPSFSKTDDINDPKGEFKRLWKLKFGNIKYEKFAEYIITKSNLKILIKMSRTFKKFIKEIETKLKSKNLSLTLEVKKIITSKNI